MTIAHHDGRNQVCCDNCPASYPNSYLDEDWGVMIADAKAAGWSIRKAAPRRDAGNTADLFGKPPRNAGGVREEPYTHTCPACARPADGGRLL